MKLGRNEPCHCGSGQKYKKCCLEKDDAAAHSASTAPEQRPNPRPRITRDMFIGGPYKNCPSCRRPSFGVYIDTGGSRGYQRECTTCRYSENYPFPEITKKVIYLDQFVISNLTKLLDKSCRGHAAIAADPFWMALFEKIELAKDLQAVVFPDSEFHSDESFISTDPAYEALKDVYEHLSDGVTFFDHHTIARFQIVPRFERWLGGDAAPERPMSRDRLMYGDPDAWTGRIRISADMGRPFDSVDQMVQRRQSAHSDFAKIFERWQAEHQPIAQTIAEEARAFGRTALQIYVNYLNRQMALDEQYAKEISAGRKPDIPMEDLLPPPSAALVSELISVARRTGLSGQDALRIVWKFLQSDALIELPIIKLNSLLFASLARKAGHGQRSVPSPGVFTDVEAISSLLPYCDAMVLDREMAGHMRDEPLRSVAAQFGTQILALNDRQGILDFFDEIIRNVPAERVEIVRDYMGEAGKPNLGLVEYGRKKRIEQTKDPNA